MTNHSQNVKIRLYIMLIALIGGISFFGYVQFNVSVANENERRITELQTIKLPVLETLLLLKGDVEDVHSAFSTALVFENYFLLEETLESANTFLTHINDINKVDSTTLSFTNDLTQDFDDYYLASRTVANLLIENPEASRKYETEILDVNKKRNLLIADIDQLIELRKQDYVSSLAYTNSEIVSANKLGAILGALLIIGLVILAWTISITVIAAVNKSNRLKKIFLDTMSHELRTPINGISGALSLLKSTQLTREQAELVDACKSSEQTICTSVDDILEFSGMVSGSINIAQRPFSVEPLISNAVKLFSSECQLKGIAINVTYDSDNTQGLALLGDEQRLCHALRHIIGNSVKFSDFGVIDVLVSSKLISNKTDSRIMTITVKDNGPGIPKEKIQDVFEPFHQIDGSFSRQHQGIGIGIPMCASIAKAMHGRLSICNRETGGLEVTFEFEALHCLHSIQDPTDQPVAFDNNKTVNVLIVEDNEVNQLVLKSFVVKMGYQSQSAMNGLEALKLIKENQFDIILMDCQMPVMDGFDATKQIRRQEKSGSHTPIIAVTANAMEGDRERCLKAGMDDYLKKPVSLDKLKSTMNKQLLNGRS